MRPSKAREGPADDFDGLGSQGSDGRVAVASQARPEAREQAASMRAWDHGHAGILHVPEVVGRMNGLLRERFD